MGSAAVTLAGVLGARVIATTGTDDKRDRLLEIGAHDVVNHQQVPDIHDGGLAMALTIADVAQQGELRTQLIAETSEKID